MEALSTDAATLRRAFAHYPTGVVAICADDGAERIGMAVSSFLPVSLDPPLVAICIQKTSTTWPRLAPLARLGISVLSTAHDRAAKTLAARDQDRFAGIDTETHEGGAVFIAGCGLWIDVSVQQEVPAGDHVIALMRINRLHGRTSTGHSVEPIVFHRSEFRRLAIS